MIDMYTASVLENKMIDPDKWRCSGVPDAIVIMAEEMDADDIPTGIAFDEDFGWCIICAVQGPYVAYHELCEYKGCKNQNTVQGVCKKHAAECSGCRSPKSINPFSEGGMCEHCLRELREKYKREWEEN